MKLKIFATLGLFAIAAVTQAANVSIGQHIILPGDPMVIQVPILISPDSAGEEVSGMNISFAAGMAGDSIPIVDADPLNPSIGTPEEFDGSIWDPGYFAASGTPSVHTVLSSVARIAAPLRVTPDGIIATYTIDATGLPIGTYTLDPNRVDPVSGVGTSAFVTDDQGNINPVALTFDAGELIVAIFEPLTVVLTAIFAVMGLGVYMKRRRG